jgi:hypothetical protein
MRGMSIVGPQELPGLPSQALIKGFNESANELFHQCKYLEAIAEYNQALGIGSLENDIDLRFRSSGTVDPMESFCCLCFARQISYVLA